MQKEITIDENNLLVMKLLHYFITRCGYNPVILQGVEDEIWLENMNNDCEIVRIVSGRVYNDEQYDFDVFKTHRILRKIKRKTFAFNLRVLSIYLNFGDNVTKDINTDKKFMNVVVHDEKDLRGNKYIEEYFPDLPRRIRFNEKGVELFMKLTNDINEHNREDAHRLDNLFSNKTPYITYILMIINIIFFIVPKLMGNDVYQYVIDSLCVHGPSIRAGEVYRLFTGMFLHASLFHLICNMYCLYIIGRQVESFYGKFKYIIIYLFSGLCASLLSITLGGNVASIGASGAIFGLMGALLYFGYYYRVYLGNILISEILPTILINLFLGFVLPGVDNFAHIGGLIGGVLVSTSLGVKDKSSTFEKVNGFIVCLLFILFLGYMGFVVAGR